jgi:hypothetical protein
MSAASRRHLARVAALPCSVCGKRGVECHHPRGIEFGTAQGVKASDLLAIPLCPKHHRTGGYGVAFHEGRRAWEEKFGTQRHHIEKTYRILRLPIEDIDVIIAASSKYCARN